MTNNTNSIKYIYINSRGDIVDFFVKIYYITNDFFCNTFSKENKEDTEVVFLENADTGDEDVYGEVHDINLFKDELEILNE